MFNKFKKWSESHQVILKNKKTGQKKRAFIGWHYLAFFVFGSFYLVNRSYVSKSGTLLIYAMLLILVYGSISYITNDLGSEVDFLVTILDILVRLGLCYYLKPVILAGFAKKGWK